MQVALIDDRCNFFVRFTKSAGSSTKSKIGPLLKVCNLLLDTQFSFLIENRFCIALYVTTEHNGR